MIFACEHTPCREIIECLLKLGADSSVKDNTNRAALSYLQENEKLSDTDQTRLIKIIGKRG